MISINGFTFGNERFKNNEVIFKEVKLYDNKNDIVMLFEDNADIANLIFATKYIHNKKKKSKINLFMPYIPYSRMDREINEQIFSLEIFASIINELSFNKIFVLDPHSDVSLKKIENICVVNIENIIMDICEDKKIDAIVFPDAGANNKYKNVYKKLCEKYPIVYGNKKRDLENKGKIIAYEMLGDTEAIKDKNIMIVDDLCVYGNTFKFATIELKKLGAKGIYLWVTHCENAFFEGELPKNNDFIEVYTTNSIIRNQECNKLITIDVKEDY